MSFSDTPWLSKIFCHVSDFYGVLFSPQVLLHLYLTAYNGVTRTASNRVHVLLRRMNSRRPRCRQPPSSKKSKQNKNRLHSCLSFVHIFSRDFFVSNIAPFSLPLFTPALASPPGGTPPSGIQHQRVRAFNRLYLTRIISIHYMKYSIP